MPITVQIEIGDESVPFELDFDEWRWSAPPKLPEGYFPIVARCAEKRYELYSDGTFSEVER
jgi:hypothetical protein